MRNKRSDKLKKLVFRERLHYKSMGTRGDLWMNLDGQEAFKDESEAYKDVTYAYYVMYKGKKYIVHRDWCEEVQNGQTN